MYIRPKSPHNTVCQNTSVSECSRVPKVQDVDNILRKMCQSHYLTISPPGLIFWEMLSNASPLTSCNRYALFLLLLEYHANKTSCSIFCNRTHYFCSHPTTSRKQNFHFLSLESDDEGDSLGPLVVHLLLQGRDAVSSLLAHDCVRVPACGF